MKNLSKVQIKKKKPMATTHIQRVSYDVAVTRGYLLRLRRIGRENMDAHIAGNADKARAKYNSMVSGCAQDWLHKLKEEQHHDA